MMYGIFYILSAGSFTFLPSLPRPSQKVKLWSQYELSVAFYRTLYDPFVLNNNFWDIPYFLLDLNSFLTNTRSPVSNSFVSLPLLRISLCISLISYTRILNNSLCLNISGCEASKWSKDCCTYEVPSLDLSGDRSIVNGKSLPMATTDWIIPVPSTGPAFQAYRAKTTHCNHWLRLPLST